MFRDIKKIQIITPCTTPEFTQNNKNKNEVKEVKEVKNNLNKIVYSVPTPTNTPCQEEINLIKDILNSELKIKFETNNIDL